MANRYKDQSAANEIGMEAIDAGFLGVNTQLDPGLLKTGAAYSDVNQMLAGPGLCSRARNMRFRRGVAETRQGTVAPTWCNPRNPDAGRCLDTVVNAIISGSALLHPDYEGIFVQSGTLFTWLPRRAADVNSRSCWQWNADAETVARVQYNGSQWVLQSWPDTSAGDTVATTVATTTAATTSPWTSTWPAGTTVFQSPWVEPWTERILAAAQFADPDGVESLMLVFPSAIYQCREGIAPIRINLPGGVELQEPVELLQTFNSMVLLRGFDLPPLAWDGSGAAFEAIPSADPEGSYTASIPNSETGAVMSNRLLLVSGRDTIAVSDILDFTRYDDALNEFRINTGEDDAITAVFPFRRTNLLVFKSQSVHLISDLTGDLSNISAEIVNSEVGCPAPKSIAAVGGDVYFLSDDGIFRLSEVVEQSMQVQERPVSEPIDSLIKRINWNAVDKCRATVHGDYYRLAVPLDGATRPNAVLVYDTVRGAWQGYDDYPANFNPDILGRTNSLGRKHAYAIDKARAVVAILDQGTVDVDFVPVTNTYATLTTAFSGDDNDWDITAVNNGSSGNMLSIAVAIEAGKYDDPDVAILDGAVTITAGDKATMIVTGTLSDGTNPIVFGPLIYSGTTDGKPSYTSLNGEDNIRWQPDTSTWLLNRYDGIVTLEWTSSENTVTPDLATIWSPENPATGTPTVTAQTHTAAQCKAAFDATDANETLFTLANKAGNNGSGTVGTLAATNLSGGFNGQGLPYPGVIQEEDITSEIQTRGYILLDDGPKRFRHGMVTLETWNPSYTIDIVTDGYNEVETVVGPRTKDRTKYYLHGKADYDTTNTDHDFDVAKREDYSIILPTAGVDLDMGLRPAQMQQCQEQFVIRRLGQWCAIKITNTQGRLALKNASMDGQNKRNMARTFA